MTAKAKYIFENVHILCTNNEGIANRHAHVFLRDGYVWYDVCDVYFTGVQSELLCIPARAAKYEDYRNPGRNIIRNKQMIEKRDNFRKRLHHNHSPRFSTGRLDTGANNWIATTTS